MPPNMWNIKNLHRAPEESIKPILLLAVLQQYSLFSVADIQLYSFHQAPTSSLHPVIGFPCGPKHIWVSFGFPSSSSWTEFYSSPPRHPRKWNQVPEEECSHLGLWWCQAPIIRPPDFTIFIFSQTVHESHCDFICWDPGMTPKHFQLPLFCNNQTLVVKIFSSPRF